MPTLSHDPCPVLGMQRERVIKVEHVETRTKTDKRVWWEGPEFWSQPDLSLPPSSTTYQEATSNLGCYLPSAKWIVMGSGGELLRS